MSIFIDVLRIGEKKKILSCGSLKAMMMVWPYGPRYILNPA